MDMGVQTSHQSQAQVTLLCHISQVNMEDVSQKLMMRLGMTSASTLWQRKEGALRGVTRREGVEKKSYSMLQQPKPFLQMIRILSQE
eukprot:1153119-Pelagomonas_calceolata.AAC.20